MVSLHNQQNQKWSTNSVELIKEWTGLCNQIGLISIIMGRIGGQNLKRKNGRHSDGEEPIVTND